VTANWRGCDVAPWLGAPTPYTKFQPQNSGAALATTGSSQDNPRLLCFLNGFYL